MHAHTRLHDTYLLYMHAVVVTMTGDICAADTEIHGSGGPQPRTIRQPLMSHGESGARDSAEVNARANQQLRSQVARLSAEVASLSHERDVLLGQVLGGPSTSDEFPGLLHKLQTATSPGTSTMCVTRGRGARAHCVPACGPGISSKATCTGVSPGSNC